MKRAIATAIEFGDEFLVVHYVDGRRLSVPLAWYPKLRDAPKDVREGYRFYQILDAQFAKWDSLDVCFAVDALLQVQGPITKWDDD